VLELRGMEFPFITNISACPCDLVNLKLVTVYLSAFPFYYFSSSYTVYYDVII